MMTDFQTTSCATAVVDNVGRGRRGDEEVLDDEDEDSMVELDDEDADSRSSTPLRLAGRKGGGSELDEDDGDQSDDEGDGDDDDDDDDVDDDASAEALTGRFGDRTHRRGNQLDASGIDNIDQNQDRDKFADGDDNEDEEVISKPIVRFKQSLFEAPEFSQRLRGYVEAAAGESVTFAAQFKARPMPTIKWYKDEEEVRPTERHQLDSSTSTDEGVIRLIINDVRTTDEGAYKCKVENQEGVASTTGYLSVTRGASKGDRGGSTRGGKLSPGAPLSAAGQCRTPGVSTPPFLRPIVEQKSMEESEELELSRQPPSPLQAFIDSIRHSAKSRHAPIFYGIEDWTDTSEDDVERDNNTMENSDADEEDVFSGDDIFCMTTSSSDSLERLTTSLIEEYVDQSTTENVASSFDADPQSSGSTARSASVLGVPDSVTLNLEERCLRSTSSAFHQRRLGQMQLRHRLAVDLPDYSPLVAISADPEISSTALAQQLSSVPDTTAASSAPSTAALPSRFEDPSLSTGSGSTPDLRIADFMLVAQDATLTLFDNPAVRFYAVFVTASSAFANTFDIHPLCLIAFVAIVSFASFYVFRQHLPTTSRHGRRRSTR